MASYRGSYFYCQPNGSNYYLYEYLTDVGHPLQSIMIAPPSDLSLVIPAKKNNLVSEKSHEVLLQDCSSCIKRRENKTRKAGYHGPTFPST